MAVLPTPISIAAAGKQWSAHWTVKDGHCCVMSAYGGARAPIAGDEGEEALDAIARNLFRQILVDHAHGRGPLTRPR